MAVALPALMLAGSALSAVGALSQADAQKASLNYNAQLRERDATVALNQASVEAARIGRAGKQAEGSLLAGYGASGVATDEGSPLDVLQMSVANAALDQETALYRGRLQATGYYDEAALNRRAGEVAVQQGRLQAASSLLTGIGHAGVVSAAGSRFRTESTTALTNAELGVD